MDKDGEELQEVMIKNIAYDEAKGATVVTLLEGFKHKYEDNDHAAFKEVLGMRLIEDKEKSINDITVTVKTINPSSFMICEDLSKYTAYEGNGIAKQVKVPRKHEFRSLEEIENESDPSSLFD
jgi:PII-like signaling protein